MGSLGEPLFYFLGLGYGLGTLIPAVGGQPYLHYVAPGLLLTSTMYSATIEATYSTFTKLEHQKVGESMLLSPLTFADVVLGELLWAASKGLLSGTAVLALGIAWGVFPPWFGIVGLGLGAAAGLIFGCMGLVVTALARGYDSFNYYFTLIISPMFFFSGVFYPIRGLGAWVEAIAWIFPLTHLVKMARSLLQGDFGTPLWAELVWIAAFGAGVFLAARWALERRFAS